MHTTHMPYLGDVYRHTQPRQKQENAHNTHALLGGCISAHTTTAKTKECTQHTCLTSGMYIGTHNHGKNKGMHTIHMPYLGDVYRHTQPRQKQRNAHNTHALLGGCISAHTTTAKTKECTQHTCPTWGAFTVTIQSQQTPKKAYTHIHATRPTRRTSTSTAGGLLSCIKRWHVVGTSPPAVWTCVYVCGVCL